MPEKCWVKDNLDEVIGLVYRFALNRGEMLPCWRKPHINLVLTSSLYILFTFSGTSRNKEGVDDLL